MRTGSQAGPSHSVSQEEEVNNRRRLRPLSSSEIRFSFSPPPDAAQASASEVSGEESGDEEAGTSPLSSHTGAPLSPPQLVRSDGERSQHLMNASQQRRRRGGAVSLSGCERLNGALLPPGEVGDALPAVREGEILMLGVGIQSLGFIFPPVSAIPPIPQGPGRDFAMQHMVTSLVYASGEAANIAADNASNVAGPMISTILSVPLDLLWFAGYEGHNLRDIGRVADRLYAQFGYKAWQAMLTAMFINSRGGLRLGFSLPTVRGVLRPVSRFALLGAGTGSTEEVSTGGALSHHLPGVSLNGTEASMRDFPPIEPEANADILYEALRQTVRFILFGALSSADRQWFLGLAQRMLGTELLLHLIEQVVNVGVLPCLPVHRHVTGRNESIPRTMWRQLTHPQNTASLRAGALEFAIFGIVSEMLSAGDSSAALILYSGGQSTTALTIGVLNFMRQATEAGSYAGLALDIGVGVLAGTSVVTTLIEAWRDLRRIYQTDGNWWDYTKALFNAVVKLSLPVFALWGTFFRLLDAASMATEAEAYQTAADALGITVPEMFGQNRSPMHEVRLATESTQRSLGQVEGPAVPYNLALFMLVELALIVLNLAVRFCSPSP